MVGQASRRAKELKQWLSFLNLHKGMLPLAGDIAAKHVRIMALATKYSSTWKRVATSAQRAGWPSAVVQHQALVQKALVALAGDFADEFEDGAIGMLWADLAVELNDPAIVDDLSSTLMPGDDAGLGVQSKKWALQAIIEFLRASGNLFRAGKGFTSKGSKHQRQHDKTHGKLFDGEL